ncbi:MAG: hypothetical protein Q8882_08745 [Bacillota bacterium]|nr:hypothetical protein [Bacillota bacterium]
MASKTYRRRRFLVLLMALSIIVVSTAAGYAFGFGTDAGIRQSLKQENTKLKEENQKVADSKDLIDSLQTENKQLKASLSDKEKSGTGNADVEALQKKIKEQADKIEELEKVSGTQDKSTEGQDAKVQDTAANAQDTAAAANNESTPNKQGNVIDLITKITVYAILGVILLIAICVIVGAFRKGKGSEDDDCYFDDDEDEDDEAELEDDNVQAVKEEKEPRPINEYKDKYIPGAKLDDIFGEDEKLQEKQKEKLFVNDELSNDSFFKARDEQVEPETYESVKTEKQDPLKTERPQPVKESRQKVYVPETLEELMKMSGNKDDNK